MGTRPNLPFQMVVALLAALPLVTAQLSADPCAGLTSVDLWLCKATFHIPEIDVDTTSGVHFQMELKGLTCSQAKVGSFHTVPNPWQKTLAFALSDVAISCNAPTVKIDHPISLSTRMDIDLSKVDLSTTLQLMLDGSGLPVAAKLDGTVFKIGHLRVSALGLPKFLVRRPSAPPAVRPPAAPYYIATSPD